MPESGPRRAGTPVRSDGRRSHEHLLAAARVAFAEQGADASLREVARQAGVSIATLYRHFPTREALLEALLGQGFDVLRARAVELLADPDPGRALAVWVGELAAATDRYEGLPARVMQALNDPDSGLYAACHGLQAAAADLLSRAVDAGRIRPDLGLDELMATAYAMAWAARQAPGLTANRLLTLLVEGLIVRPDLPSRTNLL
jgi:AcrR family transcriptional regulator